MKLSIELIPSPCWYSNVRSNVSASTWQRLQTTTFHRCGDRCEICGRDSTLECHEIWEFDDNHCTQRLSGLIGLCNKCHAVKHFGLAMETGRIQEVLAWLCEINQISATEAVTYINKEIQIYKIRSQFAWELDLRWLNKMGVKLNRHGVED